jgi:hypothetical protein
MKEFRGVFAKLSWHEFIGFKGIIFLLEIPWNMSTVSITP